jgi:hypothetical protein
MLVENDKGGPTGGNERDTGEEQKAQPDRVPPTPEW